jgi:hypothetical protein
MTGTQSLKNITGFVMVAAMLAVMAGCTSGPEIRTDYDHNADFSKYKTFGFFEPLGVESARYSSIYGSIFRTAITREMEQRGYTQSDNPDLLINVSGKLQDKTTVTTMPSPYAGVGYYGYRRGYYGAWGGYGYGSETYVSNYTEGTVNVDLVDAAEKQMVWEGVGVGRVRANKSNEEVRANIGAAVTQMFKDYPFTAGK